MAFDFPASPTEGQMFAPSGGPLYVFNSPVWKVAGITTIPGEWVMKRTVVTTGGAFTFDPNTKYAEVEVQAGGGGGGGSTTGAAQASAGGGGSAGGYAKKLFSTAGTGGGGTIVIGSGGVGGTAGLSGSAGGTSSWTDGVNTLSAAGGGLGGVGSASSAGAGGGSSPGGAATGGDINYEGDVGGWGLSLGPQAFSITWAYAHGGNGAPSHFSSGGAGSISAGGSSATTPGAAGRGRGAGGGGASASYNGAGNIGGAGIAGVVVVTEYYPAWVLDAAYAPGTIIETLYTAPSTTWNKPAGLKYLEVEGVGPGGGGGAAIGTAAGQGSAGSGAGAGAYGKKLFKASDLPASVTITIGSPGTNSLNGGTSTFGALLSLGGGLKGNNSAAAPNTATTGGLGGTASGFDINGAGAPGTAVYIITPGSVPVTMSGLGGSTPFGAGGLGWSSAGSSAAGNDAISYGGGGGGAINNVSQGTSKAGGTGGTSFFRLREIY